eukprot:2417378-Amphidinium_carterae.1
MGPTPVELETFTELTPMVGLESPATPADAASESASLLTHVGFTEADHPRYVAALLLSRWVSFLEGWHVAGDLVANARTPIWSGVAVLPRLPQGLPTSEGLSHTQKLHLHQRCDPCHALRRKWQHRLIIPRSM